MTDLCRTPDGPRDRQLLFGEEVTVLARVESTALVRASKDSYCGYVALSDIGNPNDATHRVTARATQIYARADMKSPDLATLSFGSVLSALDETATFVRTEEGYVPRQHVHRLDATATDPAAIAEIFLGAPYLWGGNSQSGIDCSGLVQAACLACAIPCPGDSDMQEMQVGDPLGREANLQRNDLVFWKGHVALVYDAETLIHANAGHMAVVLEPLKSAFERIEAQGDGQPTSFRRLPEMAT